jgi:hypothetical protein
MPNNDQREKLNAEVARCFRRFNRGCYAWSAAHHGSLLLGAVLGAFGAALLKTNYLATFFGKGEVNDLAAVCAALTTLITTVAAFAGFKEKWRANRLARGRINQLKIDLMDPSADLSAVQTALKSCLEEEDRRVIGLTS